MSVAHSTSHDLARRQYELSVLTALSDLEGGLDLGPPQATWIDDAFAENPLATPMLEPLPPLTPREDIDEHEADIWEHRSTSQPTKPTPRYLSSLWVAIPLGIGAISWYSVMPTSPAPSLRPLTTARVSDGYLAKSVIHGERLTLEKTASLVDAYLRADNLEALLATVDHPERIRTLASTRSFTPTALAEITMLAMRQQGEAVYHVAQAITTDGDREAFIFRYHPVDGWRIDWESQVAYNPHSWATMMESPPKEPLILRAVARAGAYHNYQFSSRRDYLCVELQEPNNDAAILYAYIDRDTSHSQALVSLLEGNKSAPVMVQVHFPSEGQDRSQVHLTAFLQQGWLRLQPTATQP